MMKSPAVESSSHRRQPVITVTKAGRRRHHHRHGRRGSGSSIYLRQSHRKHELQLGRSNNIYYILAKPKEKKIKMTRVLLTGGRQVFQTIVC